MLASSFFAKQAIKYETPIVHFLYFIQILCREKVNYEKYHPQEMAQNAKKLTQNAKKLTQNAKNWHEVPPLYTFCFLHFASFLFVSHFAPFHTRSGVLINCQKYFIVYFFSTRNLNEIRKLYSRCFVFYNVFRENIRKIHAKCEIW